MKSKFLLMMTILFAGVPQSHAQESGDLSNILEENFVAQTTPNSSTGLIADYAGCVLEGSAESADSLCRTSDGALEPLSTKLIQSVLDVGLSDKRFLCQMDALIVRSFRECLAKESNVKTDIPWTLALLTQKLASNWKHMGALDRAAYLYERADSLVQKDSRFVGRIMLLQDWAVLELERGNGEKAIQLALRQVDFARSSYETAEGQKFWGKPLFDALEFQARIYEALGYNDKAQVSRDDAEKYR